MLWHKSIVDFYTTEKPNDFTEGVGLFFFLHFNSYLNTVLHLTPVKQVKSMANQNIPPDMVTPRIWSNKFW